MDGRHLLGLAAESSAEIRFLQCFPGSRLIARNYRLKIGEIDLIFEQPLWRGGTELVFVEVRARSPDGWVSGLESMSRLKQSRWLRTAQEFMSHYKGEAKTLRFDVLAWNGQRWEWIQGLQF